MPRRYAFKKHLVEDEKIMKARLVSFGELEIEGRSYTHDVVITAGEISERNKKPSKKLHDEYGHTPLSTEETIPWGGKQLIIGTGANGSLPITPDVKHEAKSRGIDIVCVPTEEACRMLGDLKKNDVYAVLHCTC